MGECGGSLEAVQPEEWGGCAGEWEGRVTGVQVVIKRFVKSALLL